MILRPTQEMLGIRIDATGQRSMERQSQKRARAEDRVDGGDGNAGKDKRPEKKRQHNHNHNHLQHQQQQQQKQPHLQWQQQNYQYRKPNGSGASCSTLVPLSPFLDDADVITPSPTTSDAPPHTRPVGVFEFPWQKERLVLDMDGWDFRDVFFCSLVDGCSARIGLPGDRLGRRGAPFTVRLEDWPWTLAGGHEELEGADCIWSCALQQPLLATGGFCPAAVGVGTGPTAVAAPATANAS